MRSTVNQSSNALFTKLTTGAILLVLMTLVGATCTKEDSTAKANLGKNTFAANTKASPEATKQKGARAADDTIRAFDTVDLAGLQASEKEAFIAIVNDEVCPCACAATFAQCLQENAGCEPARLLGNWLKEALRDGFPPEQLGEVIAKEVAGFSSVPKTIETEGFARKGDVSAPMTMVEFADFQCPHCKELSETMERLEKKHSGKLSVVYKHFPLSFHPVAELAAHASEAAAIQGKFWDMHDAIFKTQDILDETMLSGHAKAIGLDMAKFEKDRNTNTIKEKVKLSRSEGVDLGIEATPALFINGRPFHLLRDIPTIEMRMAMEGYRGKAACEKK